MTKEIIIPEGWKIEQVSGNRIFIKKSDNLPKSWEEYCEQGYRKDLYWYINGDSIISIAKVNIGEEICSSDDKNLCNTKEQAEGIIALMQLLQLRDVYRKGWKPDWTDSSSKYAIDLDGKDAEVAEWISCASSPFTFQSEEIAEEFLENFKDLFATYLKILT